MQSASLFAVAVLAVLLVASFASVVTAQPQFEGITIAKVTTNGDVTTVFPFVFSGDASSGFDLVGGGSQSITEQAAGVITVTEEVPPGWVLVDISCSITVVTESDVGGSFGVLSYAPQTDGSSFTVDLAGHSVTITYAPPDIVACTFTNDPGTAAVGGVLMPVNTLALLSPWLTVIGLVGCIGVLVAVVKKRP